MTAIDLAECREELEEIQRDLENATPEQVAALAGRVAALDSLLRAEERRRIA